MSTSNPQLARRRLEPTWLTHPVYLETYGPEVADVNALAGYAPDPEQQLILDLLFAIGPNGLSVVFELDLVASRQTIKTSTIKQAELGWLFVTEEPLIVHSAHELSTTEEAFNDLATLIEDTPQLAKHLAPTRGDRPGISEGNGRWAIELASGQRVKYKARTKGGGRGLTGNKVVLDEGLYLLPSHMGSLLPTLAAVPDPQVLTASSGGLPQSAVLRDKRKRGRAGSSPRQAYIEYGDRDAGKGCELERCTHEKDAPGCALDDEERWARVIPGLGRRVMVHTVRSMRQALPPEEFAREFLVWWEDPPELLAGDLDMSTWNEVCRPVEELQVPLEPLAFGVTIAADRQRAWIGMAGARPDDRVQIELVATQRGSQWTVDWLADRVSKWKPVAVVLDGTAKSLAVPLENLGIEATTTTSGDRAQAGVETFDLLNDRKLRAPKEPLLDAAVRSAQKKPLAGGFVWEGEHVGPLVSVTLAVHGLLTHDRPTEPPPPPRAIRDDEARSSRSPRSHTADLATTGF